MAVRPTRQLICLTVVLAILLSAIPLSPYASTPVKAAPSLSVEILSWDRIGIDSNNPDGFDTYGNPVGPDQSIIQARVTSDGTDPVTNAFVSFQWTSSSIYIKLSEYETLIKSLGDLAPGQQVDVFWVVEIVRDTAAKDETRSFRVDVSSDQTSATTSQTLLVEGLQEQG